MRHGARWLAILLAAGPLACGPRGANRPAAPSAEEVAAARATVERLGGKVVGVAQSGPPLRVNFQGSKVTDADLAQLAGMTDVLNEITLNQLQVTDAGLAHLKGLTRLRLLDLSQTPITDAGLAHLEGMKDLESLTLYKTAVGDAGLEHLKSLTSLQTLHLWNTRITDTGLKHLKGLQNLKWLNIQDTGVTDAGLKDVQQALPNLTTIRR